jgi:hypothetical protein
MTLHIKSLKREKDTPPAQSETKEKRGKERRHTKKKEEETNTA